MTHRAGSMEMAPVAFDQPAAVLAHSSRKMGA
jgi:hypothetical protein